MCNSTKRSYHPFLLLAFYLEILPDEWSSKISRSTKYDWQHKDTHYLFGYEYFLQNEELFNTLQRIATHKKILKINIALLRIIAVKRFAEKYASSIRSNLFHASKTLIDNIHKSAEVFKTAKVLKYAGIPYTQYLRLKNYLHCNTPLSLCRIKHPSQLLQKELNIIKAYCENEAYRYWCLASVYHKIMRDKAAFFALAHFINMYHCLE